GGGGDVGEAVADVAGPGSGVLRVDVDAEDGAEFVEQLEQGGAAAPADVVGLAGAGLGRGGGGGQVGGHDVVDVGEAPALPAAAVDAARRRRHHPPHTGVLRRLQDEQGAVGVGQVGGEGVLHRLQHRPVGGLVEDDVDAGHRRPHRRLVPDVAFDQFGVGRH